jgi:hypothetical protein
VGALTYVTFQSEGFDMTDPVSSPQRAPDTAYNLLPSAKPDTGTSRPAGPTVFDNLGALAVMERQAGAELLKPPRENSDLTQEEKARHRIYILLVMKLIQVFWRGNKNGPSGIYHYRSEQFDKQTGTYDKVCHISDTTSRQSLSTVWGE